MEPTVQPTGAVPYPVQFAVSYPDRDLNRWTTAFRLIVAIPMMPLVLNVIPFEQLLKHAAGLLL